MAWHFRAVQWREGRKELCSRLFLTPGTALSQSFFQRAMIDGWTVRSAPEVHVAQHETGAARTPDAVAEIVGGRTRVGADTHLIEQATATAPHHRAQEARALVADASPQARHRARIHREGLVAAEARGQLPAPQPDGGACSLPLKLRD